MGTILTLVSQTPQFVAGSLPLRPGKALLGRAPECSLFVNDPQISRQHAELAVRGSTITVKDLGSRNGTYLDDEQIRSCTATPGQQLRFGRVAFLLATVAQNVAGEPNRDIETESCGDDEDGILTPARQRILQLLVAGCGEKEIAYQFRVSQHTVHNHVKVIYRILDVHSRPELLARLLGKAVPGFDDRKTVEWRKAGENSVRKSGRSRR